MRPPLEQLESLGTISAVSPVQDAADADPAGAIGTGIVRNDAEREPGFLDRSIVVQLFGAEPFSLFQEIEDIVIFAHCLALGRPQERLAADPRMQRPRPSEPAPAAIPGLPRSVHC